MRATALPASCLDDPPAIAAGFAGILVRLGLDPVEVAYHEAGHAAVALATGLAVRSLTIIPEQTAGRARVGLGDFIDPGWPHRAQAGERRVLVALGGPAGERLLSGRPWTHNPPAHWGPDLAAARACFAPDQVADLGPWFGLADQTVATHRAAVDALADALVLRGLLHEADVLEIALAAEPALLASYHFLAPTD